jgi:hypothetical protein
MTQLRWYAMGSGNCDSICQPLMHVLVERADVIPCEVAPSDSRLVGDQREGVAGLAEVPQSLDRSFRELPVRRPMHKPLVDVQGPVAIQEDYCSCHDFRPCQRLGIVCRCKNLWPPSATVRTRIVFQGRK